MVICSSCPHPPSQNIDFDKLKWGSFTKQFEAFKRQNPSSSIHDLDGFADFVLSHPDRFKKTTEKRARFYKNVIEKKGGYGMRRIERPIGGRDYSKDEGKSLGFFGNIQRAFDTSFNKKPTEQEKPILKGIFDTQKVLTDNIIKPLAPPVGYVADKQRQFLQDKYLGQGRPMKRHL